jgi:hypothetical protein
MRKLFKEMKLYKGGNYRRKYGISKTIPFNISISGWTFKSK